MQIDDYGIMEINYNCQEIKYDVKSIYIIEISNFKQIEDDETKDIWLELAIDNLFIDTELTKRAFLTLKTERF